MEAFSYLGVVFTSGGSFSEAQKTLSGQALKGIFFMNKLLYKFADLTVRHKLELFDKLIAPILNYGCQVWGFVHGKAIERVHMHFCKRLLGVKLSTQNDFIYGELGVIDFKSIRYFNIIKYWLKILNCDDKKYIKIIYLMLKLESDSYPGKTNWCSLIRDLLCSLGLYEAWLFQYVGNEDLFLSLVKQRLKDHFIQGWRGRLTISSRANFYSLVCDFKFQPYLDIVNISKYRRGLSMLRLSSHRLYIESGRWAGNIPINERKCLICNKLEDEYHFVFECVLYDEIRKKYIPLCYLKRPSMIKLIELFKNENKKIVKNLSMFIFNAFNIRNSRTYIPM